MDIVSAITKVLAVGLLFGAGLPALFAVGMRLEAAGHGDLGKPANPVLRIIGYLMFALTAAVIVVGILWICRQTLNYYFDLRIFPDFAYKS
ncbi:MULTISPECIES: hypothetical protein [Gordonia]|uniref:Uncharacterized protein n=2 Tax=Gordonia TaxID=2053 RepID=L7LEK2_9ACTN|nr:MULTISPECIES: hypothetical protein [Gordonia]AUH69996.1 hypothetical protein CXX93_18980 [Gordonia sp. YC-JH1]KJR08391.1 hypothetical protein UG54_07725 [Gordonia sihwensis]KXT58601.1 hypothetical protein Y710_03505 [Gordonia sp. QH-12]MBY4569216.1 hypothetical protein [Gordonia sihwensis]WFN93320.1 hypothetical protein P5P27_01725 [Gordonia sihwensis]